MKKKPVYILDQFSPKDIKSFDEINTLIQKYEYQIYYCLEAQRAEKSEQIRRALHNYQGKPLIVESWCRIIDYAYSNAPLSTKGSISDIGGRFNYGVGIDPLHFTPFNALYLAEDYQTAFKEKYGQRPEESKDSLSASDFALTEPDSFSALRLDGKVINIFNLDNYKNLESLNKILSKFKANAEIRKLEKKLGIKKPLQIINTAKALHRDLLAELWRARPQQYGIPSNSQIFGKLVSDAGFEGIKFPSTKGDKSCLVIFPQNLNPHSYIEIRDAVPDTTKITRLDSETFSKLR